MKVRVLCLVWTASRKDCVKPRNVEASAYSFCTGIYPETKSLICSTPIFGESVLTCSMAHKVIDL